MYVKMVNYAKDVCTSSLQCRETQFIIKIMSNLKIDDLLSFSRTSNEKFKISY